MEQNCLAKSLLPGNSVTQEVVGYVAFQDLALILAASSETDSNDLIQDSIGLAPNSSKINVTVTLTATMASKLIIYSCACDVLQGRKYVVQTNRRQLQSPPTGYDSVYMYGIDLNYQYIQE
jgi:hypothetical protein